MTEKNKQWQLSGCLNWDTFAWPLLSLDCGFGLCLPDDETSPPNARPVSPHGAAQTVKTDSRLQRLPINFKTARIFAEKLQIVKHLLPETAKLATIAAVFHQYITDTS